MNEKHLKRVQIFGKGDLQQQQQQTLHLCGCAFLGRSCKELKDKLFFSKNHNHNNNIK